MRRHVVFDEKTEIDDTLRHVFPHCCGDRQEFTGVRSGPIDEAISYLLRLCRDT
jgi:hypothetical protein